MLIKRLPQDFCVSEDLDLAISDEGPYRIYLLKKVGWNTLDAIRRIARDSGISPGIVGYAGLKDRHAVTYQYISVPSAHALVSNEPNIELTQVGYASDFVSTKVLLGNKFKVVARKIDRATNVIIDGRSREVKVNGFPNYFDDQRFRSVKMPGFGFAAERLVKGHLKGALKLHLCAILPGQSKAEKERRMRMDEVWGDWPAVLSLCSSKEDRAVVEPLLSGAGKKNLLTAVNRIPPDAMSMYIAAYQGFLWNRVLKDVLSDAGLGTLFVLEGRLGPFVIYRELQGPKASALRALEIPTVSAKLAQEGLPRDEGVLQSINRVLAQRGLSLRDFELRGVRRSYFKSFNRQAIVFPRDLEVSPPQKDEEYPGYIKREFSFWLPKGSYATMFLKSVALSYESSV